MTWMSVEQSVYEVNLQNRGLTKPLGTPCPDFGKDEWRVFHGIDPEFASQFNPGEYVDFTCVYCGHTDHEAC